MENENICWRYSGSWGLSEEQHNTTQSGWALHPPVLFNSTAQRLSRNNIWLRLDEMWKSEGWVVRISSISSTHLLYITAKSEHHNWPHNTCCTLYVMLHCPSASFYAFFSCLFLLKHFAARISLVYLYIHQANASQKIPQIMFSSHFIRFRHDKSSHILFLFFLLTPTLRFIKHMNLSLSILNSHSMTEI